MGEIAAALSANRATMDELIGAVEKAGDRWLIPGAPGKWSPSQVVEHVARALEESANEVAGRPSKLPSLPRLLRPVVRGLFFNRVLKTGTFRKAKTNKAMDPLTGPATPAEGRVRLEGALAEFDRQCRAHGESSDSVDSCVFGVVPLGDYVAFQRFHTRHHTAQLQARH